jgi:hypothetical protein
MGINDAAPPPYQQVNQLLSQTCALCSGAGGRGGEIYEESSATFPPIGSSANYFPRLAPRVPEVVKLPVCPDDLLHSGGRHMVSSLYTEIFGM